MSEVNEREAIAKALYMEFRQGAYTYQIVLQPDAVSADKSKVYTSAIAHRRVSHWSPRRNWRFAGWSRPTPASFTRDPMGNFEQVVESELDEIVERRVKDVLEDSLNTLARRNFELTKHPISVEMSDKDFSLFSQGKMSPDLYRRILRSRQAFEFPEEVFTAPEPAPASV